MLNSAIALFAYFLFQFPYVDFNATQVGIDVERAAEIIQRESRPVETQINLAVARQRAEMMGIAFQHLVAIGK